METIKLLPVKSLRIKSGQAGSTLFEVLVYVAIFVLMSIAVARGFGQAGSLFTVSRNERRASSVAQVTLDRIVREIRLACDVESVTPTSIQLRSYSDFEPATGQACNTSKTISLASQRISLNGVPLTPLGGVSINALQFQSVVMPANFAGSQAVRVGISVIAGSGSGQISRMYYATAVLRQSYAQ
ncbi:MAG: hypothetical protein AAB367_01555 [Patescibacteria group bacterium]